ncbi:50S ribosomal protein L5 [Candidatus Berkelbacteria bacterium]|nr:50S ribosomal protein L5 [Candidatus Berkelbacteria bacterium]
MALATEYNQTIRPALATALGIANIQAVPRVTVVVINVGFGSLRQIPKIADTIAHDLARVTGQHPAPRRARKAVAGFKLRAGEQVGTAVTLRGQRMYDFLERLVKTSLPRIRDFRGLPMNGFDGYGNYSFGIREHTVFPEIEQDQVTHFYGLGVSIRTTAKTDHAAEALLRAIGLPLRAADTGRKHG